MPLPTSLIASIISAVIETATQSGAVDTTQYQNYAIHRTLPPEAKIGEMLPPQGNGKVYINGLEYKLAPIAQFRNDQNLIVMPMTITSKSNVVYLQDAFGSVNRIWLLTAAEAASLSTN